MKRVFVEFSQAWIDSYGGFACCGKYNYFDFSDKTPIINAKNMAVSRVMKKYSKRFWISIKDVYIVYPEK